MNDSDERGFTLIEVLVALIILVVGLSAFYRFLGAGLLAEMSADRDRKAAEVAADVFAELGRSRPLLDSKTTGKSVDGQRWTLEIRQVSFADGTDPPSPVTAFVARLDLVPEGDRASKRFETIALKAAR